MTWTREGSLHILSTNRIRFRVSKLYLTKELLFNRSTRKVNSGLSEPRVPGVPWNPHILAAQLNLSTPMGADYAHHITTAPPPPPDFQTFLRPCKSKFWPWKTAMVLVWSRSDMMPLPHSLYPLLFHMLSCISNWNHKINLPMKKTHMNIRCLKHE